jgi:hypothetical protein
LEPDFKPCGIALEASRSRGADEAEAYFEREIGLDIKAFGGHVERFSYSESAGLGVRVFVNGRPGRAYPFDLSAEAIGEAGGSAEATGKGWMMIVGIGTMGVKTGRIVVGLLCLEADMRNAGL